MLLGAGEGCARWWWCPRREGTLDPAAHGIEAIQGIEGSLRMIQRHGVVWDQGMDSPPPLHLVHFVFVTLQLI